MTGGGDRGWRIRLRLQLLGGAEKWITLPPPYAVTDEKGNKAIPRTLTYSEAAAHAERHARSGRRCRVVDPEGRESSDVPAPVIDGRAGWWGLAMGE